MHETYWCFFSCFRAGEVLLSLALASAHRHETTSFHGDQLVDRCVSARRHLGLFQHHDGVTGTARDFVVVDYGTK
jgi:alpha-mannosidase II